MKSLRWQTAPAHALCAYIANTFLQQQSPNSNRLRQLGTVSLHDHQLDAAQRITQTIAQFGGSLLADTVGLGKTFVALAVAREYPHTHVIAPATLLPMWREAVATTASSNVTLHSLQTLSRRPLLPCKHHTRCLVIIDEAHHLRTRNTIRYQNAALFVANRDVLLLSATPIHNRPRDLQNLLALFLGHRADALDSESLARTIVRRTAADHVGTPQPNNAACESDARQTRAIPVVREHPPFRIATNPPVLEALLSLPAPLPTKDGAAASALIRLGLLRAWCSSDAALSDSLRRRQLRGEALLHSLSSGRYPTQRELQTWIVGTDSIQLGFPELLIANATDNSAPLIATLSAHLHALHALLQLHTRLSHADPERAAMLRTLLQPSANEPVTTAQSNSAPIVAFSHFASTVHALHRALSDIAGVAALTAAGGRIASGTIAKQELIAQFAPSANGRPPPAPHQRIRLLLTTDILAEGVNLQDAGTLVHLDLPWTDAARAQRVGRLARLGSHHAFVDVFTFAPPPGIDQSLKIIATLERKAQFSATTIGRANDVHNRATASALLGETSSRHASAHPPVAPDESAPEIATRLRNALIQWSQFSTSAPNPGVVWDAVQSACAVAHVTANHTGFIAVVTSNNVARVVCQLDQRMEESAALLMRAVDAIDFVFTTSMDDGAHKVDMNDTTEPELNTRVSHALQRLSDWHERQTIAALAGPRTRALSDAQKLALKAISKAVATVAAPMRASLTAHAALAEATVLGSSGAGAEIALDQWRALAHTLSPEHWLRAIRNFPQLASAPIVSSASLTSNADHLSATPLCALRNVRAILLLTTAKLRE